jgi:hypothetical protein
MFCSMRSAMRSSRLLRSVTLVLLQLANALWAASRASSMSAASERATSQNTRPSTGEMFSK